MVQYNYSKDRSLREQKTLEKKFWNFFFYLKKKFGKKIDNKNVQHN